MISHPYAECNNKYAIYIFIIPVFSSNRVCLLVFYWVGTILLSIKQYEQYAK